jgi:hypothetical protein
MKRARVVSFYRERVSSTVVRTGWLPRVAHGGGEKYRAPLFQIPKRLNIMYFAKNHDIVVLYAYSIL